MTITPSDRGFQFLEHDPYLPGGGCKRLASQSSAIGDYPDATRKPGSSFLWIGEHHHLNREEVSAFVEHLQCWLRTGRLTAP